jgi:hypothetical protein
MYIPQTRRPYTSIYQHSAEKAFVAPGKTVEKEIDHEGMVDWNLHSIDNVLGPRAKPWFGPYGRRLCTSAFRFDGVCAER